MLKKMMALAASTAMLGANAAAYAIVSARTAIKTVTGAGESAEPASGTNVQPSIPPMPPEAEHKAAAPRKPGAHKPSARKVSAAKTQHAKVAHRKTRTKSPAR